MAKSRHKKPENVCCYCKPSDQALAEVNLPAPAIDRQRWKVRRRVYRRVGSASRRAMAWSGGMAIEMHHDDRLIRRYEDEPLPELDETTASVLPHPLLPVFLAAADGAFPPADGQVIFMPATQKGMHAVVSFTGYAIFATSRPVTDFAEFHLDGFGAALQPDVLQRLAGATGEIGTLDVTLAHRGQGNGRLPIREDLGHHPRVRHARHLRTGVRVHGDDRGLVTIASGLVGRTEISVELHHPDHGDGTGRALIHEALQLVPAGETVFAAVSPGNARSLRAFLACGFRPVGSEVIIADTDR
ncbi:hypothetical protein AB0L63_19810 [Nocardia sp. NPDC051990]|uniref:hypothetical protein n=1 Tax=Nocardia sp. NPDC051990 TaxID=3155285 RepID=UPI003430B83E